MEVTLGITLMRTAWKRNLVLVMLASLLAGCENVLKPDPFLLRCQLDGGASKIFRIDPRQNEVQELDPGTLEIRSIFRTEIPDKDTKGLVDEITVKISPQEAHWEVKRYRPQIEWESNSINLSSLTYRGESGSFDDPEPDKVITKGPCTSLDPPTK